jgi:hypothetical protein
VTLKERKLWNKKSSVKGNQFRGDSLDRQFARVINPIAGQGILPQSGEISWDYLSIFVLTY